MMTVATMSGGRVTPPPFSRYQRSRRRVARASRTAFCRSGHFSVKGRTSSLRSHMWAKSTRSPLASVVLERRDLGDEATSLTGDGEDRGLAHAAPFGR